MPLTLEEAHRIISEKCQNDIYAYAKYVFGYDPASHHREWIDTFFDEESNKLIIVSPRESAKTTWMSTILLTWWIGKYPEKTNQILSVTEDQAINRLIVIRDTIISNPRWKMVFPYCEIDNRKKLTTTEFSVWDRRKGGTYASWRSWESQHKDSLKESTLMAAGAGSGRVIGNRYTGIVLIDDIHDEKNINTREQIDKVDMWFHRTVLPCLRPQAKCLIIGTRWAPEDLLGRLTEKKLPIFDGYEITGYNSLWKTIQTNALWIDEDRNYVSYWPENWPVDRLLAKKEEVGEVIFELMYNSNPYAMSSDLFKAEWLENVFPARDKLPFFRWIDIGVDPAFTKSTRADNSAVVLLGVTPNLEVYNLDMEVGKFDKNELRAVMERMYYQALSNYGKVDRIWFEKVGAQVAMMDELVSETGLPIEGVAVNNKGDKVIRAQAFSITCANGKYYCDFTTRIGRMHYGELLSFPTAPHDDTVDAVAIVLLKRLGAGHSRAKTHIVRPKFMI